MNFEQIKGLARIALAMGGGAVLTAAGVNADAVSAVVQGSGTPGGLLLGLLPIAATAAWSLYGNRLAGLVDKAVTHAPEATAARVAVVAPVATADALDAVGAPYSGLPAGRKPSGLSRMVDK